jgi:hypothetical protein
MVVAKGDIGAGASAVSKWRRRRGGDRNGGENNQGRQEK